MFYRADNRNNEQLRSIKAAFCNQSSYFLCDVAATLVNEKKKKKTTIKIIQRLSHKYKTDAKINHRFEREHRARLSLR